MQYMLISDNLIRFLSGFYPTPIHFVLHENTFDCNNFSPPATAMTKLASIVTICEQFWPAGGNFLHWCPSKDLRGKFIPGQHPFIGPLGKFNAE